MPLAPARPRHVPTQERARRLVQAVCEAALELLNRGGPDALTTHRIAERAGVSVGSLYYYFPNKEAVVATVFDAVFEQNDRELAARAKAPRPADEPIEQAIAELVRTSFQHMQRLARLHEAFLRQYSVDYDFGRHGARAQRRIEGAVRWVTQLLERHREELAIEDPARTARTAVILLVGALRSAVQRDAVVLDDRGFERELVRALIAYFRLGATIRIGEE